MRRIRRVTVVKAIHTAGLPAALMIAIGVVASLAAIGAFRGRDLLGA
jgi:hypothetical protein